MVSGKYEPNKEELTPASNGRDRENLLKSKETGIGSKTITIVKDDVDAHELAPLKEQDEEREVVTEKVVPKAPDGGYGWVIVVASFFCNFIVDGVAYSFAIYLTDWSEVFPHDGKDKISLVGSLLNGVYLCMGPISSALTNAFGFRVVIFSGAIIAAAAFVGSAFCTSVNALIGVFGILGGIGFGLIYSPSILCVCYYFEKKRALAVGICVCGSGVGAFAFPPLIGRVVDYYGWAGSMFILAGLVLQVCIAGAFMKTLAVEVTDNVEVRETPEEAPLLEQTTETYVRDANPPLNRTSSLNQPTNYRDLKHLKPQRMRNRSDSEPGTDVEIVHSRKYYSQHGIDVQTVEKGKVEHRFVAGTHRHYFSTPDISQDIRKIKRVEFLPPFARKDIVVQGSLKHLDRASKEKLELDSFRRDSQSGVSRRSQTKTTETIVTTAPAEPPKKSFLPPELRQALKELSDFSIYTNVVFLIFSLASFFGMVAFYIPFMFITDYAKLNIEGVSNDQANLLISAIGLTNIFGRLFWGWLSDRPNMDPLIVHNCAITVVAIVLAFIPACLDYYSLAVVCGIFGFFVSPFISLLSIILTSRIGLDQLPSAFGQSQLVRGIASMVGSPFGGFLYEKTKNYSMTFWVSSAEFILAVVIASMILVKEFFQKRRSRGRAVSEVRA
ncbi:monocarboxylate transporter 12-like [Paramacrobiotus metropolitanus]|uniref:monocarboxylate transporter 12-like n=1 Tax=Paramacrobiotus metropolitanus TaxID=2943436 RepID=UPI002445B18F|nr:monocarboxylate transporter 12-like [Paramacrobiotus metropolitanus]XP_055338783.1 monocarboxylate transporter 12-like [Paramacrobiotus metropolitanus]